MRKPQQFFCSVRLPYTMRGKAVARRLTLRTAAHFAWAQYHTAGIITGCCNRYRRRSFRTRQLCACKQAGKSSAIFCRNSGMGLPFSIPWASAYSARQSDKNPTRFFKQGRDPKVHGDVAAELRLAALGGYAEPAPCCTGLKIDPPAPLPTKNAKI